jgi:hypothetical protein
LRIIQWLVRRYGRSLDFAFLLVICIIFMLMLLFYTPTDQSLYARLSSRSNDAYGSLALAQKLGDLGYEVRPLEELPLPLASLKVLFVLAPTEPFGEGEIESIVAWVKGGGTLVVAAETHHQADALLARFGLILRFGGGYMLPTRPVPAIATIETESQIYIEATSPSFTPYLASQTGIVWGRQPYDNGQVWLSASVLPFANIGFVANSGQNLLNFLPPAPAIVGFDEVYKGNNRAINNLGEFLFNSRAGIVLLILVSMAWLLLYRNRRFRSGGRAGAGGR